MSAALFLVPVFQALSTAGPINGAKAFFYQTGTTTDESVFTTSGLGVAHAQPVVADSSGRFDPIYLDSTKAYKLVLKDAAGTTIKTYDPLNVAALGGSIGTSDLAAAAVTAAKCAATLVADLLGYTAANLAGATFTGECRFNRTLSAVPASDSAGFLGAPQLTYNAAHTLIADDCGRSLIHTDGTGRAWTIPLNASVAFPLGTLIFLVNAGTGAVTITRTGGVVLRLAGAGTDANYTLAQYGMATLYKYGTDEWWVSGSGLS